MSRADCKTKDTSLEIQQLKEQVRHLQEALIDSRQTQKNLRASEEVYRKVFQEAADAILLIDPNSGALLEFNDRAYQSLGYNRNEFKLLNLGDLENGEYKGNYEAILRKIGPNENHTFDTRFMARNGEALDVQISARLIKVRDEDVLLTILRDITEKKRLEKEQTQLRERLQHSQKMESIGTLAGGIAHDFNNILWAITGFTEMTLSEVDPDGEARDNLVHILEAATRAKGLVEQILTFSRQTTLDKEALSLGPLVKETMKLIRASIPSTVDITLDITGDECRIRANATQMHQILMNLCSNAAQAMKDGGGTLKVGLETINVDEELAITHPDLLEGEYVRLSVEDTGLGMEQELIDRIFDPFFTTKNPVEGTGMGLAAVHGIVKNHDGAISVVSNPGKGSLFRVYLPREESLRSFDKDDWTTFPTGVEKIMFVDDEELLVVMTTQMLTRLGYDVVGCVDSLEALEHIQAQPDTYDLVVTDLTMPRMTGLDLARAIGSIRKDLPIILCTGYSNTMTPEQVESLGIRAITPKPLVMGEIAQLVRSTLDADKRNGRHKG